MGEAVLRTEVAATRAGLGVALPSARAPQGLLLPVSSHTVQPLIEPRAVCNLGEVGFQGVTRVERVVFTRLI